MRQRSAKAVEVWQTPVQAQPSLMRRCLLWLFDLLVDFDFEPTEFFGGVIAAGWGLFVWLPWVQTFASTPSYDAMRLIAPEWLWGALVGTLGAVQLLLLFRRPRYRLIRARLAILALMTWLFVGSLFILANPASTATVMYIFPALMNLYVCLRLTILTRRP